MMNSTPLPTTGSDKDSKRATSVSVHYCGECPHVHIALRNEYNVIYADFVLGADQIDEFFHTCLHTLLATTTAQAIIQKAKGDS